MDTDNDMPAAETEAKKPMNRPTSRRTLMLGAAAASAVVAVRPAMAQAAGSVLNCEIPIPGPHGSGMNIDAHGALVTPDTPGSFTATGQKFSGEQVKRAINGGQLPGTSYEQNQAYVNYIRRLQAGQSGFTCFHSLQMPR
jgi:ABC-type sugar transport system substrate-binding protein